MKRADRVLQASSGVVRETEPASSSLRSACLHTAVCTIRSLHAELMLYPKPGLVSPVDNGSHSDMDADLFMRSLFALRHYFKHMAQAGTQALPFDVLKELGCRPSAACWQLPAASIRIAALYFRWVYCVRQRVIAMRSLYPSLRIICVP